MSEHLSDQGVVPSGTVAFLFTDIEGSTRLWEGHRAEMEAALARHDEIVRSAVEHYRGYVFSTAGDAFSAAFATSSGAVAAALEAQRRLQAEPWPAAAPIRVRMGLHVGTAQERDGDYFGTAVNRAARLMSLAHGGQIVVSEAVQQLVRHELPEDARLTPLGRHVLRGLTEPETVLQLSAPDLVEDFAPLASTSRAGNLPSPPTSFIGRVEQVKRLAAELVGRRLVTLLGPGGVGKTRLSIEAAALAADDYPDGVFVAELASVTDPGAVPHAVCTVLGTRPQEGMDPSAAVVDALAGRRVLLVLDNTEHVLAAAAELTRLIMSGATGSTILATSREPLGTPGEQVWPVPPLDPSLEGVDLFGERASLADAAFEPGDDDRALIEVVCRHLDGIPLAIELAAARLRSMTIADLAERLDDRFVLLRGPRRGGVERHQTLRATIDWSYRLLDDAEALLFDRLSVFAGAFDLAAAEAVCGSEPLDRGEIFELLTELSDRSMLSAERGGAHVRWRMLETLRQYGADRLAERGGTEQVRDRHVAHFAAAAEAAHRAYAGRAAATGVAAFEEAWDNLRVAFNRAVDVADVATAKAILEASAWYCWTGLQAEHGDWVDRARALAPEDPVLTGLAGYWAGLEGDQRTALALGEAAVAAAPAPDAVEALFGWMAVTYAKFYSGQADAAAPAAADAAAARSPDPFVRAVVASFSCLGTFAVDEAAGVAALARACELSAELDNGVAMAFASYQSGNVHFSCGDHDQALLDYERSLAQATAARARMFELWSRTMLAARASEAGWPDAEARFAESLRHLADNRIWSRAYGVLAALADHWAGAGGLDQAAVLIGFLDQHDPVSMFLVARQRERAAAAVAAYAPGAMGKARGRALDRHAILDFALTELAHPT